MDCLRTQTNRPVAGELNVAIVSDEPEFVRVLMNRWQAERVTPAFTVVAAGSPSNAGVAFDRVGEPVPTALPECELVVLGGVAGERVPQLQRALYQPARPLICVVAPADYRRLRDSLPQALLLPQGDCWAENVVLLAGECLRRAQAVLRAQRAEQLLTAGQRHATLGKYVVEMRHNVNNALTSVLGNSELLLLNGGSFTGEAREQLETIRGSALRLHEIMRRFWSLESEMRTIEDVLPEAASRRIAAPGSQTDAAFAPVGVKAPGPLTDVALVSVGAKASS